MGCLLGLRALKTLYFYFCKVIKKIERIFAKNFARNYEKNNTWNIRRLVNETIVHNDLKVRLEIQILKVIHILWLLVLHSKWWIALGMHLIPAGISSFLLPLSSSPCAVCRPVCTVHSDRSPPRIIMGKSGKLRQFFFIWQKRFVDYVIHWKFCM